MGRKHFWFTVVPLEENAEDTDLWAMDNDFISITPLRLDLTNHQELERLRTSHPFRAEDRSGDRPSGEELAAGDGDDRAGDVRGSR